MDFRAQPDAPPNLNPDNWRSQLLPDSRHRLINKMVETMKRHFAYSGQEGLHEIKQAAIHLEETCYTASATQSAYLRSISLRMLNLEVSHDIRLSGSSPAISSTYLFKTESNEWRTAHQELRPNKEDASE